MGIIAWDSTPTAGDCYNATSWANMVTYIKHSAACNFTIYDDNASTNQKFKFTYTGDDSTLEGAANTTQDLLLKANSTDAYPKIVLNGNSAIDYYSHNDHYFYADAANQIKIAGNANDGNIYGPAATGKNLRFYANQTDAYPYMRLNGNADALVYLTTGSAFYLYDATVQAFKLSWDGADTSRLYGGSTTGNDLRLYPNTVDSYGRLLLRPDDYNELSVANGLGLKIFGNGVQELKFTASANLGTIEGGHITGDDLKLKANDTDTYPYITLLGDSQIQYQSKNYHYFYSGGAQAFEILGNGGNCYLYGNNATGKHMYIKANETDTYPYISLLGNAGIRASLTGGTPFEIYSGADSAVKMMGSGTNGYIYGPAATGKTLYLYANATDAHPFISLAGLGDINLNVDTFVRGYDVNSGQIFKAGRTGDTSIYYGTSTTGGALTFKASDVDTYPYITMTGNADMQLRVNTGNPIHFYEGATNMARILMSGTNTYLYGPAAASKNLTLTANYADTYPVLTLDGANGNIDTYLRAGGNLKIKDAANLIFKFELSGNYSKLTGQDVTTKSMQIQANSFETYPRILMEGNASINNYIAAASSFNVFDATTRVFTAQLGGGEAYWAGKTTAGGYLHLRACDANAYPHINMKGNDWIHLNTHTYLTIQQDAVQAFYFNYGANSSDIYGGATTDDWLFLHPNTADSRPYFTLTGTGSVRAYTDTGSFFSTYDNSTQAHRFTYAANVSIHEGGHITGDDLKLKANDIDARPYILMRGADYMYFDVDSTYKYYFAWNGFSHLQFGYTSPDISIIGGTVDKNIFINPTGTGLVKFGTYAATGDTASNGYITILDAAGNTRKLMTCA